MRRTRLTPRQKRSKAKLDAWNSEMRQRLLPLMDWDEEYRELKAVMRAFDRLSPAERERERGVNC